MEKPVLVLLAAGIGSRYGGLKQIDPVDGAGNLIIDFSIYDALRAGFEDLVFIIKRGIYDDFMAAIGGRISKYANMECAFQELDDLPPGMAVPPGREKPYGTTHALLCARREIGGRPFAVINSDDYYGPGAFRMLYGFLSRNRGGREQLMVGYRLENTLTDHGGVARGICRVDAENRLVHIEEHRDIRGLKGGGARAGDSGGFIPGGTPVSMNCWGFKPCIFSCLERTFLENLPRGLEEDPLKYEDLLPNAVQAAMAGGEITVRVRNSPDRWFGVTYKEDKPAVMQSIARLKAKGLYSENLWPAG